MRAVARKPNHRVCQEGTQGLPDIANETTKAHEIPWRNQPLKTGTARSPPTPHQHSDLRAEHRVPCPLFPRALAAPRRRREATGVAGTHLREAKKPAAETVGCRPAARLIVPSRRVRSDMSCEHSSELVVDSLCFACVDDTFANMSVLSCEKALLARDIVTRLPRLNAAAAVVCLRSFLALCTSRPAPRGMRGSSSQRCALPLKLLASPPSLLASHPTSAPQWLPLLGLHLAWRACWSIALSEYSATV